jgi:hypothetical protein
MRFVDAKRGSDYAVHRMPSVPGAGGNVNPSRLPAHDCFRRILVIAGCSRGGPLSKPKAVARPQRREPLKSACPIFYRPTETW